MQQFLNLFDFKPQPKSDNKIVDTEDIDNKIAHSPDSGAPPILLLKKSQTRIKKITKKFVVIK